MTNRESSRVFETVGGRPAIIKLLRQSTTLPDDEFTAKIEDTVSNIERHVASYFMWKGTLKGKAQTAKTSSALRKLALKASGLAKHLETADDLVKSALKAAEQVTKRDVSLPINEFEPMEVAALLKRCAYAWSPPKVGMNGRPKDGDAGNLIEWLVREWEKITGQVPDASEKSRPVGQPKRLHPFLSLILRAVNHEGKRRHLKPLLKSEAKRRLADALKKRQAKVAKKPT